MTNMKPPQEGRNTGAPSLRGLQGRSATGLNGQAAKEEVSAIWRGGWMPENISGVPAGRSVFHLTSPLIGLLTRPRSYPEKARSRSPRWDRHALVTMLLQYFVRHCVRRGVVGKLSRSRPPGTLFCSLPLT